MSEKQVILRVDATYDLTVKVGDRVRQGERLSRNPEPDAPSTSPATGVVRSVQFDPERHEFVIVIAQAT
jgi:Na+-translocating ferredoxin:NAD+ oxidoreductase RnfC subunit